MHVEGIQIIQWYRHHSFRDVSIDVGKALPSLQVAVGSRLVLVIIISVAAVLLGRLPVFLLFDALLKENQRFLGKPLEAIRSWRCEKGCSHVFILQLLGH